MTQSKIENVAEKKEVAQQQTAVAEKVEQPAAEVAKVAAAQPEQETQEQINWKKFREAREQERKQKEAAEKRASEKEAEAQALKSAMEALLNKSQMQPHQASNGYEEELSEDEKIQRKVDAALAVREKQLAVERQRHEQETFPQKLVEMYPDFPQVCTEENLDYLEYHYPEVAAPFKHLPETKEKWAAIYKAVKRFIPNTSSKKDEKRAEKNFNKPQSMSVPGVTQVGDTAPMQLDDARRNANWQRMQRVMKGGR